MVWRNHQSAQSRAWSLVSDYVRPFGAGVALFVAGQMTFGADSVEQQVQAHLEAGEFGLAIEKAVAAQGEAEKTTLLKEIAGVQAQAGENRAASATLRRIPDRQVRAQALRDQSALNGGGATANPGPLMMLIQQNTEGEWEQIDGVGGSMSWFPTGVKVSPGGVLERITTKEHTQTLSALGIQARKADLNRDLAQPSPLRLVSLTRLERELNDHLTQGRPVPNSMSLLAGLTKIQYVLRDDASDEILIGGPAEGWEYNAQGQAIGVESKLPVLMLDDFVTVYRTFSKGTADFGCSINTRDSNVKSLQDFVAGSLSRGSLNAGAGVRNFVNQIQKTLGYQDIVVWGVPADSRVARVIVEADYRMKLIGIGKHDAGKAIPSYFDLLPQDLQKNPAPMEALRWWLTMNYDAVLHSEDKSVFEIHGASVLCQSENQLLTSEGKHLPTGKSEGVNRMFAENFTRNYSELAEKDLIFAEARNVFDLALISALICKEDLAGNDKATLGAFAANGLYRPASYAVPKEVESVVNHKVYRGHDVVVQAAGGVRANIDEVLSADRLKTNPQLTQLAEAAKTPELPAGRWWWDAAK